MSFKATITVDLDDREAVEEAIAGLQRVLGLTPKEASTPAADRPPDPSGGGSPVPSPPSTTPSRPLPPSSRIDAAPAERRRLARQGNGHRPRGVTRDLILAFIRANPGCGTQSIMNDVQIGKGGISSHIGVLVERGLVRSQQDGKRKLYFPIADGQIFDTAEGEPKSGEERKIVECLLEADGPLPANEISLRTGIRSDHVPSMCSALQRRRVISAVPPKKSGLPTRWQPISRPSVNVTPL